MRYRIVYVKDVEFGAVSHDFVAANDKEARKKAREQIRHLERKYGQAIMVRRLQCVESWSEMTEKVRDIMKF